ncbi:MAG TPA: hypothetical protein DIC46_04825 [Porphyromonadaceae bacterium]|jgi:hypothetical protein|nr:hypothetical protein [Porphyromonadaceae bacterium]
MSDQRQFIKLQQLCRQAIMLTVYFHQHREIEQLKVLALAPPDDLLYIGMSITKVAANCL